MRMASDGRRIDPASESKKALVSEGLDDKPKLDFVGCGGKI
jgi:hypothetical protein